MTAAPYPNPNLPWSPQRNLGFTEVVDDTSSFQRFGFHVLLFFLFLVFSRIMDVKYGYLHITGASYRIAFAMVLLSRGFLTALGTPIGKALLGFTFWMGLSVPFSMWKGGSMPIFKDNWLLFAFVTFLAVAGLIHNYSQYVTATKTLAWAFFAFALVANVFGTAESGRLVLSHGKFANPNEMAQALLLGLPLWGAIFANSKSVPMKFFSLCTMLLMLATTVRTGSRGALVAFAVMFLAYFLRASVMQKMQIIIVTVLFVAVLAGTMSNKLIARYKTIADEESMDTDENGNVVNSARASTDSRKTLLKHSLIFTMRHPLFGVGPGMFPAADEEYSRSLGIKSTYLGTHNSYTQVSSELGIPAFIFFISAIGMTLFGPYRVYARTIGDPRLEQMGTLALGLHYSVIIFVVTILFEHIAYSDMLPVFGGLSSVLLRTVDAEIQRIQAVPLPVAMTPAAFQTYMETRTKAGQAF